MVIVGKNINQAWSYDTIWEVLEILWQFSGNGRSWVEGRENFTNMEKVQHLTTRLAVYDVAMMIIIIYRSIQIDYNNTLVL